MLEKIKKSNNFLKVYDFMWCSCFLKIFTNGKCCNIENFISFSFKIKENTPISFIIKLSKFGHSKTLSKSKLFYKNLSFYV